MKLNKVQQQGFVKTGKRVTTSTDPELKVTSTYNQFNLNEKGCTLLGVEPTGIEDNENPIGYVRLWDMGQEEDGLRFFITKGFFSKGKLQGAKLGANRNFTLSPSWGAMQGANPNLPGGALEVTEISKRNMRDAGIMDDERDIALYQGTYDIAQLYVTEDGDATLEDTGEIATFTNFGLQNLPIEDGKGNQSEVEVFALINPSYVDHNPKG